MAVSETELRGGKASALNILLLYLLLRDIPPAQAATA
jgi:hypothetical protein